MWWGHPYGFGFVPFVFPLGFFLCVALCFFIVRMIFFRRFQRFGGGCGGPMYGSMYGPWNKDGNPELILKQRLAKGEISEEEYKHLCDTLKD